MSYAWNVAKYASANKSKTGFFVDGFIRSTQALFDRMDGIRAEKIAQFKVLCAEVLRRVQERTPVLTGNAKAGWRLEFVKDDKFGVKAAITNGVTYVIYLEYGTVHMSPRPMLRITLAEVAQELRGG